MTCRVWGENGEKANKTINKQQKYRFWLVKVKFLYKRIFIAYIIEFKKKKEKEEEERNSGK